MYENIIKYFPQHIQEILNTDLNKDKVFLEEIRLRCEKPIILKERDKEIILNYILRRLDIEYIFERICENSVYTYQEQICNRIYNNSRWT